jgi:LacI family transcriptional regulator
MSNTIKDVARVAGVSVATVSAVANGTKFVSERLAKRVRDAIETTGYQPHEVARSLKSGSTQTIGLIIGDITNPFFTTVARSVEDAAHAAGYTVMLCNTDENLEKERLYLQLMRGRRVDGLIWAAAGGIDAYKDFDALRTPATVLLDRRVDELALDTVVVDNIDATRSAIEYLIELGHARIALITGLPHLSTSRERLQGYREALASHGLPSDDALVVQGNFRSEGAYAAALTLLRRTPRPTAVFASNNLMAIGLLLALSKRRLRCPEDVSVAAFDDFEEAALLAPALTTIAQPTQEIGKKAVELLLKRIQRVQGDAPEIATMPAQLLLRKSCGTPSRSPSVAPQSTRRSR